MTLMDLHQILNNLRLNNLMKWLTLPAFKHRLENTVSNVLLYFSKNVIWNSFSYLCRFEYRFKSEEWFGDTKISMKCKF